MQVVWRREPGENRVGLESDTGWPASAGASIMRKIHRRTTVRLANACPGHRYLRAVPSIILNIPSSIIVIALIYAFAPLATCRSQTEAGSGTAVDAIPRWSGEFERRPSFSCLHGPRISCQLSRQPYYRIVSAKFISNVFLLHGPKDKAVHSLIN